MAPYSSTQNLRTKIKFMLSGKVVKVANCSRRGRIDNIFAAAFSFLTFLLTGAGVFCLFAPSTCLALESRAAFYEGECFALVLVDAPNLEFADFSNCRKSLRRAHLQSRQSFGHVWLVLVDRRSGLFIECGYTGETSSELPGYFDGIKLLVQRYCTTKMASLGANIHNPIGYLMLERDDGQLQLGSGGHKPTCAWGIALTRYQLQDMLRALQKFPKGPFHLAHFNCTTFVKNALSVCDVQVESCHKLQVPRRWKFQERAITLWSDAKFATLRLSTPDALQNSILSRVPAEEIKQALAWYKLIH